MNEVQQQQQQRNAIDASIGDRRQVVGLLGHGELGTIGRGGKTCPLLTGSLSSGVTRPPYSVHTGFHERPVSY